MSQKVITMGITEAQKTLFESTYNNMKECGRKGNGKYTCSIPVELLKVDPLYQRMSTSAFSRLKKLASRWTEDKLTPIIVVPHPEEYSYYIIDGYHRYIVSTTMLQAKYKALDAIVLTRVPKGVKERQKFEAELFIGQGTEVERITPVQMHNARILIGDVPALDLEDMLQKYKVSYVSTPGQREKAVLGSYTTAYDISKHNGRDCLEFIFSIINNAGWRTETNGYSKTIMKCLKDVWCAYQHPELHNRMHEYYSEKLRDIDPGLLVAKSRSKYPERNEKQTVALYLADMLVDELGFEKSKYFEEQIKFAKKKVS